MLAVLPALCEELAFRGFILTAAPPLPPWTAVFLSSFLFASVQMNVFQFVPHFVFGLVLGLIVLRTGSVAPAMVFHLVYNLCFIAPLMSPQLFGDANHLENGLGLPALAWVAVAAACAVLATGLLTAMLCCGRRPPPASLPSSRRDADTETLASANGAAASEAVKQAPS